MTYEIHSLGQFTVPTVLSDGQFLQKLLCLPTVDALAKQRDGSVGIYHIVFGTENAPLFFICLGKLETGYFRSTELASI
jgi:hypothetical protein